MKMIMYLEQKDNIVWLNTPCLLSYENHKKLSFFLRNTFEVKQEIFCKCGKVLCEEK